MDEDNGFEYPVDFNNVRKMLEVDISKITLCVILIHIMIFVLICMEYATYQVDTQKES